MSFREFKIKYSEYIKNRNIQITTIEDYLGKRIFVVVERFMNVYLEESIKDKIVKDLKKIGFIYDSRIEGYVKFKK